MMRMKRCVVVLLLSWVPVSALLLRSNATTAGLANAVPDLAKECELKFGMCLYPCTCVRIIHTNDVYTFLESDRPSSAGKYVIHGFEGTKTDPGSFDVLEAPADKEVRVRKLGSFPCFKSVLKSMKDDAVDMNFVPILTFGGDLLGPSYLSNFETAGFHMVEALNELEIDITTWGNHEFDQGTENGLRAMRCSRYAWLNGNCKEIYQGGYEGGLLGSNYLRKGEDWSPRMSVLDGMDFPYQPATGILEVVIDSSIGPITRPAVKMCFGGLTTDESGTKKYISTFMPANSFAPRFKIPDDGKMYSRWRPSHMPIGMRYGDFVSIEDMYRACPVHSAAGKNLRREQALGFLAESELSIRTSEVPEEAFSYYLAWQRVVPTMLDEAYKASCDSYMLVTHLKFKDDIETLEFPHPHISLLRFSGGGHDHDPHIFMQHLHPDKPNDESRAIAKAMGYRKHSRAAEEYNHLKKFKDDVFKPIRNYMYPDKLHIKIGMDGQLAAKVDYVFSTALGKTAEFSYMKFNFAPKHMEWDEDKEGKKAPIYSDIIAVNPLTETEDMAMRGLQDAFDDLTQDLQEKKIAKRFLGTYNTVQIRKRQTRVGDFFMDIMREWSLEKQESKSLQMLRLVTFVNAGAIRSGVYGESMFPIPNRAYSMLEIKADWPIQNNMELWMMSAEDAMMTALIFSADQGDGLYPMFAGLDVTYEIRNNPKRLAFLTDESREVPMVNVWGGGAQDEYLMNMFKPCEAMLFSGIAFIRKENRKTVKAGWDAISHLIGAESIGSKADRQVGHIAWYPRLREDTTADSGPRTNSLKASHENIIKSVSVGNSDLIVEEIKDKYSPTRNDADLLPILSGMDCVNPNLKDAQRLGSWHAAAKGIRTPCSRSRLAANEELPIAQDEDQVTMLGGDAAPEGRLIADDRALMAPPKIPAPEPTEGDKAVGAHFVAVRNWARKYALNQQEEVWQKAVFDKGGKAKPFLKNVPWRDVRRVIDSSNWARCKGQINACLELCPIAKWSCEKVRENKADCKNMPAL